MKRLVVAGHFAPGEAVPLSQEQLHYLQTVLRLSPGDKFVLIDQQGQGYLAVLQSEHCHLEMTAAIADNEPQIDVELCLPLLKGDKLEWVIQKSVELGVQRIVLYSAARSVVKVTGSFQRKLARWQTIAVNAVQQCRRTRIPEIVGMKNLEQLPGGDRLSLFAWEEAKDPGLSRLTASVTGALRILVGPEGGLTEEEAEILTQAGWQQVSLGPRILRAETAAIAMLTCVLFAAGELG
ncbi:MAG: 16S rRNA (uracil(1498)-N(3))-methyltransferase [Firmicutes bacterium]|nr:16S rRNA (uracil(1498)-N(3))-methyltransferase [Bacillota bacterium]